MRRVGIISLLAQCVVFTSACGVTTAEPSVSSVSFTLDGERFEIEEVGELPIAGFLSDEAGGPFGKHHLGLPLGDGRTLHISADTEDIGEVTLARSPFVRPGAYWVALQFNDDDGNFDRHLVARGALDLSANGGQDARLTGRALGDLDLSGDCEERALIEDLRFDVELINDATLAPVDFGEPFSALELEADANIILDNGRVLSPLTVTASISQDPDGFFGVGQRTAVVFDFCGDVETSLAFIIGPDSSTADNVTIGETLVVFLREDSPSGRRIWFAEQGTARVDDDGAASEVMRLSVDAPVVMVEIDPVTFEDLPDGETITVNAGFVHAPID